MEIVELRVQVEKSQLDALQAQVKALQGTTINFGAGAGGSGGKGSDPSAGVRAGLAATEKQANRTGQSILSVVGKVAKWTAVTTAVYAPIHAFKEALTTIKQLDTEMVNIQKVTGASAQQMKQFQDQAYALASQYGRSAMDVAESMTAFARAGYGEQFDQMAELSTLMQNVGYVSADTANSMLLAVDAAWHLNGSQTELMKVMDGVDKITNQNATDFGKMAEGMTVAASVFAESGESIQTFAALVGTGTAVTQRSGSEIARGLRTVLMNIRQIKGETEDGELIDGESIANASKALKEFAGINTMENGELRKASDILSELAAKWDELDSVQQSAISEALAGKRQANILMALMGNWDMYEKQMEEYATAAGTALKENEIYMDSWAAKSEQLKSSWTEFVSGLVSTDMIKGGLDALIGAVEFLDSGLGHAAIGAAALAAAFSGIAKIVPLIAGSKAITGLVEVFQMFKTFGAAETIGALLAGIGPLGVAIAGLAAVLATPAIIDFFTTDYGEQADKVKELTSEYEQLYGAQSEYQALLDKKVSDTGLNDWEQKRLDYLQQYRSELNLTIEAEKELAQQKYQEQYGSRDQSAFDEEYYRNGGRGRGQAETVDVVNLRNAKKAFEELTDATREGRKSQQEYQQGIDDILATYQDFYNDTKQGLDAGILDLDSLTKEQQELFKLYELLMKIRDVPLDKMDVAIAIEQFQGLAEVGDKSVVNWQKLKKAMEEAGASAEDIEATLASMQQDDSIILIDVEADGAEETLEKIESIGLAVEDSDGWKINIDGLVDLMTELGMSQSEIQATVDKLSELNGVSFVDAEGNVANLAAAIQGSGSSIANIIDGVEEKVAELDAMTPDVDLTATDNVSAVADTAKAAAQSVEGTYTATFTGNTSGLAAAVGRAKAMLEAFKTAKAAAGLAKGTQNWTGGPVLLGDEASPDGSPRPELVITKGGKAFVAGLAGPTMTSLPAGARVYPYQDTVGILSGADITEVAAFSAGNDRILQHYLNPTTDAKANAGGGGNANAGGNKGGGGGGGNANKAKGGGGKVGGGGGGSSGSSKEQEDTYLQQLQDELDLLRAQYDFLEASGASTDALISKSGEIQGKLHDINERLRETGGEEKDIVDNSTAWYKEQKNIEDLLLEEQEKRIKLYEDERDLLQTNLTLMEHQGKSAGDRIGQLRQIQDNLHREAEYLRSIKADQKEINELSIEWWETQNEILEIQNALWEELDAAVQKELKKARDARDDELAALDARLEQLQAERDAKQEQLDLEEKLKKVEESRFALENAQNERNVRYYNAATGQWEWGADAKTVKSARESLEQAQKDLSDYQDELAYQATVDAINRRKDAINAAYDALEAGWEKITESIQEPGREISQILADIAQHGTPLMKAQVDNTGKLLGDLNNYIRAAVYGATGESYVGGGGTASFNYSNDKTDYSALMDRASSEAEFQYWAEQRNAKAIAQGIDITGSGWRSNEQIYKEWKAKQSSGKSYSSSGGGGSSGSKTAKSSSGGSYTIGSEKGLNFVNNASAGSTMTGGDGSKWTKNSDGSTTITKDGNTYKVYDSGGVLSGMGGIKGTSEDEIVIPPALANYMLRPSANQQFQQRMAELGFLYGAGPVPSAIMSGASGRGGASHYGDIYQYGNITLSESQAKTMTVYELAQKSRGLSVYAAVQ